MTTHSNQQYTPLSPTTTQLRPEIISFYERFYKVSDSGPENPNNETGGGIVGGKGCLGEGEGEERHKEYAAGYFTEGATLVIGSKRGVGYAEILKIRKAMWENVSQRSHNPIKIFPFGSGEDVDEVMLYGTVAYVLKDGRRTEVDWAARAKLVKEGGELKMSYYQVYLDSAAMQNAK